MTRPVSLEDLSAFNAELLALVQSGVSLERGLADLANSSKNGLGALARRLSGRMQQGESLSAALQQEGSAIPSVYGALVQAGVRSGRLTAALEGAAELAQEVRLVRQQVGQALLSPLVLLLLSFTLTLLFGVDLLHRYRDTYDSLFVAPPPWVAGLLWLGDLLQRFWWVSLIGLGAVLWSWWRSAGASLLSLTGWSAPLRWVPGVSRVIHNLQHATFARLLALLCEQQVPLPEGLRLAGEATGDRAFAARAGELAAAVERGDGSAARVQAGWPTFLQWALSQGVQGVGLATVLRQAAQLYRRRAAGGMLWLRTGLPLVCTVLLGGLITLAHAVFNLGPMAALWFDLAGN
jgi:general secretion pathway protein F